MLRLILLVLIPAVSAPMYLDARPMGGRRRRIGR